MTEHDRNLADNPAENDEQLESDESDENTSEAGFNEDYDHSDDAG